jgi:hypothetical protein
MRWDDGVHSRLHHLERGVVGEVSMVVVHRCVLRNRIVHGQPLRLNSRRLHGMHRLHGLHAVAHMVMKIIFMDRVNGAHAHRPVLIYWCWVHIELTDHTS